MTFNPDDYSIKKQFGSNWFRIRPAKSSDRDLVWQGYQDAPKEFFRHLFLFQKTQLIIGILKVWSWTINILYHLIQCFLMILKMK